MPTTDIPSNTISPELTGNTPVIKLNNVVLPAPFGPIKARQSPCPTSKLIWSKIVFPLIFGILLALRLVVRKVDNGVMSYLLCSGVERRSVWFTQMLVIITNLFVLIAFCTGLGLGCSALMFPGDLDIGAYLVLNLGVFILQLTLTGICYMCSCIFNEYRLASLFGAGIPIVFIMIQMLSNMQGSMEGLKFATLLTLFDPQKLINGNNEGYLMLGGLLVVMIVCYGVGGIIFDRKSMSL